MSSEPTTDGAAHRRRVLAEMQAIVGPAAAFADAASLLVYDTDGYFMGVGMAEKLAREGKAVTYVTPFDAIAPYTRYTLENPRLNRTLRECGVRILKEHALDRAWLGGVELSEIWDGSTQSTDCDTVVLVTQRRSQDAVYRELRDDTSALEESGIVLYRVGDCEVPQIPADAIFSGHRLAREIDSPNPAVPRPYVRERRLLDATEDDYQLDSQAIAGSASS